MAVEVEIRDFQSVEHVRFRVDGFTALVGRSNIGKSALVRAVQCALTGAVGVDFVRHGLACERRAGKSKCRCFSQVRIQTSQMELTWEKGDTVNRYVALKVGEKEVTVYDKIGRGPPDFLHPEFTPVHVSGSAELVQVSEQWSPIFLLNQSGPVVADVLSDVAQLDRINHAMRLVEKDRRADVATRKVREKDIVGLIRELESYKGLDGVFSDVAQMETRFRAVQEAQDSLDMLEGFLGRVKNLATSLRSLRAVVAHPLPNGEVLEATTRKMTRADDLYNALLTKAQTIRRLRGVKDVTLPDKSSLEEALSKAVLFELWINRIRVLKVREQRLEGLDACGLPDETLLLTSVAQYTELQRLFGRQVRLTTSLNRVEALLAEAEVEEQTAVEGIQKLGVCPTCSQDLGGGCLHLEGM